jgi:hypothetical protein
MNQVHAPWTTTLAQSTAAQTQRLTRVDARRCYSGLELTAATPK